MGNLNFEADSPWSSSLGTPKNLLPIDDAIGLTTSFAVSGTGSKAAILLGFSNGSPLLIGAEPVVTFDGKPVGTALVLTPPDLPEIVLPPLPLLLRLLKAPPLLRAIVFGFSLPLFPPVDFAVAVAVTLIFPDLLLFPVDFIELPFAACLPLLPDRLFFPLLADFENLPVI